MNASSHSQAHTNLYSYVGSAATERQDLAALDAELAKVDGLVVRRGVSMKELGRWKIGGKADLVVEPESERALAAALQLVSQWDMRFLVLGSGSNLLFDDAGYRGVIIHIGRGLSKMRIDGIQVSVEAGMWVPYFARRVGVAGLTGAEHTIGIPGSLGGLLVMNGGSQRKGIGANVVEVVCIDTDGNRHVLSREDCAFSYRHSVLQYLPYIIVKARFAFAQGDAAAIRREMISIMKSRRLKFPLKLPNCGSVFLSDPAMYAVVGPPGKAIQDAGLRGRRIGNAQISPEHGNFIVNLGNASSRDVLELISLIRRTVFDQTGFHLSCEVRHVSPNGRILPAHMVNE